MKGQLPGMVGALGLLKVAQADLKGVMYKDYQAWTLGVEVRGRCYKFWSDVVKSRSFTGRCDQINHS